MGKQPLRVQPKRSGLDGSKLCYWCGNQMNYRDPYSKRYRTRDHLWPRSMGGTIIDDNIVMACRSCNERRGCSFGWVPYFKWRNRTKVRGVQVD